MVLVLKSVVSYVHSASDTEVSGMLDALTNADLNSAMFVAAVTGPKSSIELQVDLITLNNLKMEFLLKFRSRKTTCSGSTKI